MNKENCALKLVDEIILYYDAWSKKYQITKSQLYISRKRKTRVHAFTSELILHLSLPVVDVLYPNCNHPLSSSSLHDKDLKRSACRRLRCII